MNPTRFIQISTLTSYAASLLNRDDSGYAKRMPFGGVVRTRISSQCLKKHWRGAEDDHSLINVSFEADVSVRSRITYVERIAKPLAEQGLEPELIEASLLGIQELLYGKSKKQKAKDKGESEDQFAALARGEVVVLGLPEIEFIKALTIQACQNAEGDPKKAGKEAQALLKKRRDELLALKQGSGMDVAMFGRFVSGDPEARVNSAVHVAHALTVHAQNSETDYFSAVDDLTTAEHGGSGHLGASELTSGLFYSYVVVELPTLVNNLVAVKDPQPEPEDWALAGKLVKHLIHLMATVSPGAKLGSTAPYEYAKLVLVEAGSRQPRTLANAFLNPVSQDGDVLGASMQALCDYISGMDAMYGGHETRWQASILPEPVMPDANVMPLSELSAAVESCVARAGGAA
jgi:CRISPR system Cascade subunit CasC